MKTKEELSALKEEVETLNKKLAELSEEELKAVTGGNSWNEYWGEDGYFRISQSNAAFDANSTDKCYNSQNLSETGEEEKKGYNVGFFPGLSGFP